MNHCRLINFTCQVLCVILSFENIFKRKQLTPKRASMEVVYSRVADNVPRLPPNRLRGVLQPIMSTLNWLSASPPSLVACL